MAVQSLIDIDEEETSTLMRVDFLPGNGGSRALVLKPLGGAFEKNKKISIPFNSWGYCKMLFYNVMRRDI